MKTRNLYLIPLKYAGLPALIAFAIGMFVLQIRGGDVTDDVLIQAIPFIAIFIGILMLFIMLIAFIAIRLHKRISHRYHRLIELTLVIGILFALVSTFQSINMVGFSYGFLLLFIMWLSFTLWTHITPRSSGKDAELSPFTAQQNGLALLAAIIVLVISIGILISTAQPQEPYGIRQKQWDSYDEARQTEISDQIWSEFYSLQIPYFVLLSLIPGALVFFTTRELIQKK
ncbi:hypothetical protein MASR2M15_14180 [Anaerolineales bacterium]